MEVKIYKGFVKERRYGEYDEALFIGNLEQPIALEFQDEITGEIVTVRYWISDKEKTKEQLQTDFLNQLYGEVEANYGDNYSEYTGYLWTDEDLMIGGHDLLNEIRSYVGKYIYLEIEIN